jgi:hypothetical protein
MGVPFMTKDKKNVLDKAKTNKYSRHGFLTAGGAALAGSALAVYSPSKAEAKEEKELQLCPYQDLLGRYY